MSRAASIRCSRPGSAVNTAYALLGDVHNMAGHCVKHVRIKEQLLDLISGGAIQCNDEVVARLDHLDIHEDLARPELSVNRSASRPVIWRVSCL